MNGNVLSVRCGAAAMVLALASLLWACSSPQSAAGPNATAGAATQQRTSTARSHDLSRDEASGGHTLKRHVGRSDQQLRERLEREHIAAASTYTDREMAEAAVGAALEQDRARIEQWLARTGGHPNLVSEYDADRPLGRTLHRGETQAQACSHATVVLKWDGPGQYHVLTSYPECR